MSDKLFKVPADWAKNSYVNQSSYEAKYKESINNNEKFWADEGKRIHWFKPYTKIVEVIRQVDYTTGTSYTVTGTNITFSGTPAPGNSYTLTTPGAPFQFSETYLGPGMAKETWLDRTTEQQSTTTSISVFTQ